MFHAPVVVSPDNAAKEVHGGRIMLGLGHSIAAATAVVGMLDLSFGASRGPERAAQLVQDFGQVTGFANLSGAQPTNVQLTSSAPNQALQLPAGLHFVQPRGLNS